MWHHDVTNARTCQFFRRLFDRLPVRISTSDLHHRILRKKLHHIRAYDFGVQFSFKDDPSISAFAKIGHARLGEGGFDLARF